jgi:hypothetical protein
MSDTSPLEYWLSLKLGESDTEIELERRADVQHATDLMITQVCHSLDIHSRDLDAPLYNRSDFLDKVARVCTSNHLFRMRVLCTNPTTAVIRGHRLIELSRKHSSAIEIRQVHQDYWHYNEAFLIADNCGFIHRPLSDRYEGVANFNAPVIAQRRLNYFNEVWERSEPHPDLRRLHI